MIKAALAASLLIASATSAGGSLSAARIADSVDKSKHEAWAASDSLRLHMADILSQRRISDGADDCIDYGMLLRKSAADRIFDADLIMTAITNDGEPPNLTQRYSASVIYLSAKRDLEKAIIAVDKCFLVGGAFK